MDNERLLTVAVIPMRGLVLFPGMTLHFDIGRKTSVNALKYALAANENVFLVTQRDINEEEPMITGLYPVGVVAAVKQVIRPAERSSAFRVVVEGLYRASLTDILSTKPFIKGSVAPKTEFLVTNDKLEYSTALLRSVRGAFMEYCDINTKIAPDIIAEVLDSPDLGTVADKIAANVFFSIEDKARLLAQSDPVARLERLNVLLSQEIELLLLEDEIQSQVQEQMDKNQREYYLREQLKVIHDELGEGEDSPDEADRYRQRIAKSLMSDECKEKLYSECRRLAKMSPSSPDANVIRTYLDKCLDLPWGVFTKDSANLSAAKKQLDRDHFGLKDVKERFIELLAARMLSSDIKGQIICLAGPPGVGKTSVARSVAKAMHRRYVRVSLGGVHDEAEIRGHRRTYIGAIPGRIVNALIDAKSQNPLILLDEIDKLNGDFRGDPASALLEVLDPEQNSTFTDHFIDLPFDLSHVLFITTANDKYAIPEPLRDRMEIIELSSYTHEEKFNIAKKHLLPKLLKEHAITKRQLKISDKAIRIMIDGYTKEAGVRRLEQLFAKIMRKAAVSIVENADTVVKVTDTNIEQFLGPVKYRQDAAEKSDEIGVVNGLAWTSVGGEMLKVEVSVLDGTGKLELTGSLGDVMKESARIAVSLVRSRCAQFGIDGDFYKNKDIHIHFPEGAVPKDGPSAGVTMTTALFSALAGIPARSSVAMTGEITLRGRVLPIGGLKEKSMAAYRSGISTVLIPVDNLPDLSLIDDAVKEKITFIPVETIDEALSAALRHSQSQKKQDKPQPPQPPEFKKPSARVYN